MAHGSDRRGKGPASSAGRLPSQRQLRVGELVRHALSEILTQGKFRDPALDGRAITVPEVRMSPDLRNATAFVMPLGGGDEDAVVQALMRNRKYIRGQLARKMTQKFTPDLTFSKDRTFETFGRIDELLRTPVVARDLQSDEQDSATGDDTEKT